MEKCEKYLIENKFQRQMYREYKIVTIFYCNNLFSLDNGTGSLLIFTF